MRNSFYSLLIFHIHQILQPILKEIYLLCGI